jgi:hypothetical protein
MEGTIMDFDVLQKDGVKPEVITALKEEFGSLSTSVSKLEANNKELKNQLIKARGTGNEEVEKLNQRIQELEETGAKSATEYTKQMKALQTEREAALKELDKTNRNIERLLIDDSLTKALVGLNLPAESLGLARDALRARGIFQIKTEGDLRKAIAVITKDGKANEYDIGDFISKEWANTDEAKRLIPASNNSGGGAANSNGGGTGSKKITRAQFDALSAKEKSDWFLVVRGEVTD